MHLVDPTGHKLAQTQEGFETRGRRVVVVLGGRVRAPIHKQMLFGTGLEPLVGGGDRRGGGQVFGKVERDGWEGDHVRNEGTCHKGHGGECIMLVPRSLVFVRRTVPGKVEEKIGFVSDLLLGKTGSPKGGESLDESQETSGSWVDLRGGTDEPKAPQGMLVADQAGQGGGHASL